jgi:lipopolysaccharide/colanic/teichoic acid biosynthesis glycosyltransferase
MAQSAEYWQPQNASDIALELPARHVQSSDDNVVIDLRADEPIVDVRQDPRDGWVLGRGLLAATKWEILLKRIIDSLGALSAIIVFSPLMIATAIAIKLTSRGPVLFIHERSGKHGESFRFAKFRSMYVGSHEKVQELEQHNEVAGPVFKIKRDPRITPVGRFIRKYSIDELPQFFHILSGRMSLVGPRPPLPGEVEEYENWQRQRLLVKPGLTCLWQVNGRSNVDFEHWCELDLQYIAEWSLILDLKLLLKTIPAVLSARGAY